MAQCLGSRTDDPALRIIWPDFIGDGKPRLPYGILIRIRGMDLETELHQRQQMPPVIISEEENSARDGNGGEGAKQVIRWPNRHEQPYSTFWVMAPSPVDSPLATRSPSHRRASMMCSH